MKNKKNVNEVDHEAFGLTKEEAEGTKDIAPNAKLGDLKAGESARYRVVVAMPKKLTYVDKNTNEEKGEQVLTAINRRTNIEETIWLSSKTLRMEFLKLYKKHNTLMNLDVVISAKEYDHPKYGKKTRGYTVQIDHRKEVNEEE